MMLGREGTKCEKAMKEAIVSVMLFVDFDYMLEIMLLLFSFPGRD